MDDRRVLVIGCGARRWHEIALCLVCLVIAVMHYLGPAVASETTMSPWVWNVFYAGQAVGAVAALAGLGIPWASRHVEVGLILEQAGMLLIAAAGLVYATAVFALVGWSHRIVTIESLVLFMWVGASLARAWQIRGELRQLGNGGP